MNPSNQFVTFFGEGEPPKRKDIPDDYQEFLPEFITKDRYTHPYSYDPFLIYYNEDAKELKCNNTIYTDRLSQWDYDRLRTLCRKHFDNEGDMWADRDPEKIEAFLSDWAGKKVTLIANIQYVNLSSGYPLWRLDFHYE